MLGSMLSRISAFSKDKGAEEEKSMKRRPFESIDCTRSIAASFDASLENEVIMVG